MKALIAMSGGVDSSMAALLTQKEGFECIGCTMKLFENRDARLEARRTCCSLDDVEDARRVAMRMGIPYVVFNYQDAFQRCVIDKFVQSYAQGLTPNPCIDCNRFLKFDLLLQRAGELGCDAVVTGHYARVERDDRTGRYLLRKGLDASKDQSYVLYQLTQEQLAHTRMPLGGLTKAEVRRMAEDAGFVTAHKADSEDICFVPDGNYAAVIERELGRKAEAGDFVDPEGNVIGRHRGIIHYTIGQRKHLGQTFGTPRYVCGIDAAANRVVLGGSEDVYASRAAAKDCTWVAGEPPAEEFRCKAKLRYRQTEAWTTVRVRGDRIDMTFDEPLRAVTPGQAAVLYDGDIVLGGGTLITEKE